MNKPKSLGELNRPNYKLISFDGNTGDSIIELNDGKKKIRLKTCAYGTRGMVDIAREIVGKQQEYIKRQWRHSLDLAEYTGYKEPKQQ